MRHASQKKFNTGHAHSSRGVDSHIDDILELKKLKILKVQNYYILRACRTTSLES